MYKLYNIIFLVIFVGLFFLPRVVEGNLYFSCCDDTRLYYIFPQKYIENYAKNLVIDNTWAGANTGYYPGSQMIPILLILSLLKKITFLNTQYLFYGVNLAFAFTFLYLFLGLWLKKDKGVRIFCGLFYVFSPFLIKTLYQNQLFSIHLVWALPATLYFLSKSVMQKRLLYTLTAVLIFSIFTTGINTLPFFVPIFVTSAPLFVYLLIKHPKSTISCTALFIVAYLFLNAHWLFHFINSIVNNTGLGGIVGNFSSDEFIAENIRGIKGASTLFSPLNQPLQDLSFTIRNSLTPANIFSLVFVFLITLGGIFVSKKENARIKMIYLVFLICLLTSWFLISPNFESWGPELFLLFATKIPGFTMFRNMFDKFAQPLAFYYAVALGFSLSSIFTLVRNMNMKLIFLIILIPLILFNAKSRFYPYDVHEGIQAKITGEFNDDFTSLINYLQNDKSESRVLWLPLNYPTYVSVEDKHLAGHFYSGLSPLRYLANRQDYAGHFSFIIPGDTYLGEKLVKFVKEKKYDEISQIIQIHNVGFVIQDKQVFPERMQQFLYGTEKSYLTMQTTEFQNLLRGKKIADFGSRYTLYEINPLLKSNRIYLTTDPDIIPTDSKDVSYSRKDGNSFEIEIHNLTQKKYLVLLDPFYKDWTLYLTGKSEIKPYKPGENIVIKNYANGWEIDPEITSENPKFILRFKPAEYDRYLYPLNIGAYIIVVGTQVYLLIQICSKKFLH